MTPSRVLLGIGLALLLGGAYWIGHGWRVWWVYPVPVIGFAAMLVAPHLAIRGK